MNNFWGPPDEEPLEDWMNPAKCKQVNEQKEMRKKSGKDLMSVINECLQKPPVPQIPDKPQ